MGRIDDSLATIENISNDTERTFQLAGLLSTCFKLKGVVLVVTGQLAFDLYTDSASAHPELDLAPFSGKLNHRMILEVMRGQLHAHGMVSHWTLAGVSIHFHHDPMIQNNDLCRDFMTDHGVVKLLPAEEITADRILASVYPEVDEEAQTQARLLLINGLTGAFHMDWTALHRICHLPDYRVGEELAQMRLSAKKDVDAIGATPDHIGQTSTLPSITESVEPVVPSEAAPAAPEPAPAATPEPPADKPKVSVHERAMNSLIDGI